MTPQDIEAEIRDWVHREIGKRAFGEAFGYAVSLQLVPSPQGLVPVWNLMVTCRNPLVGQQPLWRMTGVPEPRPAEKEVRGHVERMMQELRGLSAQVTAGANGHPSAGA